jgi:hypothetical protein
LGTEEGKELGNGLYYQQTTEIHQRLYAYDRNFDIEVGRTVLQEVLMYHCEGYARATF